ncbi:MAG TPA: hypothetical protein VF486_15890, partial [Actinomycetes bacterium]
RRRARYARRMAAATSVTLAAVLVLAVAGPRVLADRSGVTGRARDQVVSQPWRGYELVVPSGWTPVDDDYPFDVVLAPTTAASGSRYPRIAVTTGLMDPGAYPGGPGGLSDPERLRLLRLQPGGLGRPNGPAQPGRRADGRAFVHTEVGMLADSATIGPGETYYLAWPYYCAAGVRCPPALRYRTLLVTGSGLRSDGPGLQALRRALRRIVETVRPVTSALPGGASASRPACRLQPFHDPLATQTLPRVRPPAGPPQVGAAIMTEGNAVGADFFGTFGAGLAMCHVRQRFTVEILERGRRAPVQGSGTVVTIEGDLPEADGKATAFTRVWIWRNWCGGPDVTVRFPGLGGYRIDRPIKPGCRDRGKPSTLEQTSFPLDPKIYGG